MANQRNSPANKCLFCNKRQPSVGETSDCYVEINGKQLKKAFWVCGQCGVSEKDPRAVHSIVLTERKSKVVGDGKSKDAAVIQVVTVGGAMDESKKSVAEDVSNVESCSCQACLERKRFEQDQLREAETLQKCWLQLRHAVRQMYRDRLLRDGVTGKGKKFDMDHLRELVEKLGSRDPHQLYQRLESLGREHVMELKVLLLHILVSPDKADSPAGSKSESIISNMTFETAEHFLKSLLNCASQFFETIDSMKALLLPLEKEHLEKFGITWRVVNCNMFDSVVYHDPLIQATLPSIYSRLGFKVSLDENSGEGNVAVIVDRKSTPVHVADMMKNFVELGATLAVCRKRMELAQERMEDYLSKQMKIYKFVSHARARFVDISSRKRCISGNKIPLNCDHPATVDGFHQCRRNNQCSCDHCSISHMIACAVSPDSADVELPESFKYLDLPDTPDSSSIDSEDSDYDKEEIFLEKGEKFGSMHHKRGSITCEEMENLATVESTVIPKRLKSVHSPKNSSTAVVQRHMYNAYGDWEVNSDPATLLFSNRWEEMLFPEDEKQNEASKESHEDKKSTTSNGSRNGDGGKLTISGKICMRHKSAGNDNGASKMNSKSSSDACVAGDKIAAASILKRHVTQFAATATDTKRPATTCGADQATGKQDKLEAKCDGKEKQDNQSSPKKSCSAAAAAARVTKASNGLSPQFTQEWFKDPKNAKYAKALLACAVAGNNIDVASLKDLNLDVETVRKLYWQHLENIPVTKSSEQTGTGCQDSGGGETQKPKLGSMAKPDSISGDEDDDSWSDHSSVVSQKENKHCDCCYCEMFGHGGGDMQKSCGRSEYPQIRERLRLKLKKKESELPSQKSENVDGYRGYESLDALLEYINGSKVGSPETRSAAAAAAASGGKTTPIGGKKSKKSQTKGKKNENKKVEKRDQIVPSYQRSAFNENDAKLATGGEKRARHSETVQSGSGSLPSETDNGCQQRDNDDMNRTTAESHGSGRKCTIMPKTSRKRNSEEEDVNIDEVFKPKDIDLNSTELDEEEREIERFKRFVMDCQPRENRAKVHLNIGHLLREKKSTATVA